jgi:hypothetical protein
MVIRLGVGVLRPLHADHSRALQQGFRFLGFLVLVKP